MSGATHVARLFACVLLLAGCSAQFDHLVLVPEAGAPTGTEVSASFVSLPEGATFAVDVTVMDSSGPILNDFSFNLVSADTSVLGVEPTVGRPDGTASFVFFGVSPGSTQINVLFNDSPEKPIPATVTVAKP
jgi:hypothetical protein